MSKMLKIVVKEPQKKPEIREAKDLLQTWQELVGGYIEIVPFAENREILAICNEEGKLVGLSPNIMYGQDILVGTVVFVGNDAPEFRSLTDDEIGFIVYTSTQLSL